MKNTRTLKNILKECAYDEKCTTFDDFSTKKYKFRWQKLRDELNEYYGLPFYNNKYHSLINGFATEQWIEFYYVYTDCRNLILKYQLKEILKCCSKTGEINSNIILESEIDVNKLLDTLYNAYDIKLQKWQLFPSPKENFSRIFDAVYHKAGFNFDKEVVLSKDNFDMIVGTNAQQQQNSSGKNNASSNSASQHTEYAKGGTSTNEAFNQMSLSELFNLIKKPLTQAQKHLLQISSNERKFADVQQIFVDTLSKKIAEAEEQENYLKDNLVQDHLVIAFFGETNAGKSTIIDTFRILFNESTRLEEIKKANGEGTDGCIVGDGRCDFTQTYNEYSMMIDGKQFTLIDVPGIEGNEAEYKEGTRKALQKAHCIFYVHGSDKKPNTKTTEKIKEYLNDWVSVYSICNIRGNSEDYEDEEDRETLMSDRVKTSMELSREVFKTTLGRHYMGNIPVQGLLALCSKANFSNSRQLLIGTQEDLKEYFGSSAAIYNFSHFQDVIEVVRDMSLKYKELIVQSNKSKVGALAKRVITDINACITKGKGGIDDYLGKLNDFDRNVYSAVSRAKQKLAIRDVVEYEFDTLRQYLFAAIDKSEQEVKEVAKRQSKVMERNISDAVASRCAEATRWLNQEIKRHKRGLEASCRLPGTFFTNGSVDIKFDTNSITSEMKDFDFGGAFNAAMTAAGLAALIPGVGWIAGGLIALGGALFGGIFGNDGKAEAKRKVDEKIDEIAENVIVALNRETIQVYKNNYTDQYNLIHRVIVNEKNNVSKLQREIEDLKEDMKITINYTK